MVLQSRRKYLAAIRNRYRKASRKEKFVILGEFCVTYRLLRVCLILRSGEIRRALLKKRRERLLGLRRAYSRGVLLVLNFCRLLDLLA